MWCRKISLISHRNLNLLLLLITVWNPRNFLFCIWLFDDSAAALPRRREAHVCAILSCSSWHLLVVSTLDSLSSSANPHTPQNASIKSVNTHHCSTVEVMPSSFSRPPCAKKIVIFYMPARLVCRSQRCERFRLTFISVYPDYWCNPWRDPSFAVYTLIAFSQAWGKWLVILNHLIRQY